MKNGLGGRVVDHESVFHKVYRLFRFRIVRLDSQSVVAARAPEIVPLDEQPASLASFLSYTISASLMRRRLWRLVSTAYALACHCDHLG